MKKYLTIGFILWLGIAGKVYASSPASWYASSTPQAISPTAINGVQPKLLIPQLSSTGSPCLNVSTSGLIATTTCATTSPAGSSGQLQYNNGGVFGATSSPVVGYITATSTTATSTFNGAISVPKLKWGGMFSNQYPLTEDANGNVSLFSNLYLDTGFSTPGVHIPSALYVNSVATNYISSNSMGLNISGSGYGIQANDFLHANDNLTVTGTTTSPCFSNNGTTCITGGGGSIATNPLQATYFTATSSTATSTFPIASTTNLYLTATSSYLATNAQGKVIATTSPVGGSQTPWTSDIDAAGYALNNINSIQPNRDLNIGTNPIGVNITIGEAGDKNVTLQGNSINLTGVYGTFTINNTLDDGYGNMTVGGTITANDGIDLYNGGTGIGAVNFGNDGTSPTNPVTPAGWQHIQINGADAWLPYYQ